MKQHTTVPYFLNPIHPITVHLIGCGGTGSHVLSSLCRLHEGLIALGHPGLHVIVFDGDQVTKANVGRQLFSQFEIGMNKAIAMVSKINRHAGLDWLAVPNNFDQDYVTKNNLPMANLAITCVDNVQTRVQVLKILKRPGRANPEHPACKPVYWMDFGNSRFVGQVILGCFSKKHMLPNIFDLHPTLAKKREKDDGPSCSMMEALQKQDLFINSSLAQLGGNMLWKLFTTGQISFHGFYLNLETMKSNPIPIP